MIIQVTNLNSSNVERFDYDTATETLTVQFKSSKKRYVYKNVHKSAFLELLNAGIMNLSVGGIVATKIKPCFDCEIEEDFLPSKIKQPISEDGIKSIEFDNVSGRYIQKSDCPNCGREFSIALSTIGENEFSGECSSCGKEIFFVHNGLGFKTLKVKP